VGADHAADPFGERGGGIAVQDAVGVVGHRKQGDADQARGDLQFPRADVLQALAGRVHRGGFAAGQGEQGQAGAATAEGVQQRAQDGRLLAGPGGHGQDVPGAGQRATGAPGRFRGRGRPGGGGGRGHGALLVGSAWRWPPPVRGPDRRPAHPPRWPGRVEVVAGTCGDAAQAPGFRGCRGAGSRRRWRRRGAVRRRRSSCPGPAPPRPARTPVPAGRARPRDPATIPC